MIMYIIIGLRTKSQTEKSHDVFRSDLFLVSYWLSKLKAMFPFIARPVRMTGVRAKLYKTKVVEHKISYESPLERLCIFESSLSGPEQFPRQRQDPRKNLFFFFQNLSSDLSCWRYEVAPRSFLVENFMIVKKGSMNFCSISKGFGRNRDKQKICSWPWKLINSSGMSLTENCYRTFLLETKSWIQVHIFAISFLGHPVYVYKHKCI